MDTKRNRHSKALDNRFISPGVSNATARTKKAGVDRSENDNGRYGGFLAVVSEGEFQSSSNYWTGDSGTYISHNMESNTVRSWVFQWTAPDEGTGDAVFTIYFNVVNGEASTGDQWSYLTAISLGTPQEASGEVSIHELGVTLMQYWIGLLGIAVVLLSVLISYIVMRGGSSHYRG